MVERRCLAYEPSLSQELVRPHGAGFVAGCPTTLPVCFINRRMPNGTSAWCGRTAGVIPPPTRCAPGRAHSLGGVSPLHTRQGAVLAEQQGCPSRGGIRRKLEAKRCSDEQPADRGDAVG